MADQVEVSIPKTRVPEGTNFTATAYFRTRATGAASTPTTVQYRLDNITGSKVITDWTTVSPASSVTIVIKSTENAINGNNNRTERLQIMVKADDGLSTQTIGSAQWRVINLFGIGT